jgi:hypothetical protein
MSPRPRLFVGLDLWPASPLSLSQVPFKFQKESLTETRHPIMHMAPAVVAEYAHPILRSDVRPVVGRASESVATVVTNGLTIATGQPLSPGG